MQSLNFSTLIASLRAKLMARQLHYNVYTFRNGDAVVSATVRGKRMTMQMMYLIKAWKEDVNGIEISGYGWSAVMKSEQKAITKIVSDIRKYELKFNKYLN